METDLSLFSTTLPIRTKYIILPFCKGKHIPVILVALVVLGESGFIWKQDRATFAAKHLTCTKTGTRSLFGSEKVIKRGTRYEPKHMFNIASCQLQQSFQISE